MVQLCGTLVATNSDYLNQDVKSLGGVFVVHADMGSLRHIYYNYYKVHWLVAFSYEIFSSKFMKLSRGIQGPISSIKFVRFILNCAYVVF